MSPLFQNHRAKSLYYTLSSIGAASGLFKFPILSRIIDKTEFLSYSALFFLGSTFALLATVGLREHTELSISHSLRQQKNSSSSGFSFYIASCFISSGAIMIALFLLLAILRKFFGISIPAYALADYIALGLCCFSTAIANLVSIKSRCIPGQIILAPCFSICRSAFFLLGLAIYYLMSLAFPSPIIGSYILIIDSIAIVLQVLYILRDELFSAPSSYRQSLLRIISYVLRAAKVFPYPKSLPSERSFVLTYGFKFGIANLMLSVIQIFDKSFVSMVAPSSFALDYIQLTTLCSIPSILAGIEMQPHLARLASIYSSIPINSVMQGLSHDSMQFTPRQFLRKSLTFCIQYRYTLFLSLAIALYPIIPYSFPVIRDASLPSSQQIVFFSFYSLVLAFSSLIGQKLLFDHRPTPFLAYAILYSFLVIMALSLSSIFSSIAMLCYLLFIVGILMFSVSYYVCLPSLLLPL